MISIAPFGVILENRVWQKEKENNKTKQKREESKIHICIEETLCEDKREKVLYIRERKFGRNQFNQHFDLWLLVSGKD